MEYINKFAYIINIDNDVTRKEYPNAKLYKIGEGTKKRPYSLIEKYDSKNAHVTKDQIPLNIDNSVRITDGNIRNYLLRNFTGIFPELPAKVAYILGNIIYIAGHMDKAADGLTECLVIPDSYDVIELVNEACEYFKAHKKEASGKVQQNYTIPYDVKHLVDLNLGRTIHKFLLNNSGTGIDLYKTADQEILFIGQFDNVFLNRIADENNITLFIDDTKNYESTLTLEDFNIKIIYSTEELEEIMAEKDFDIVISNPPYGKLGAEITKNIIDNIDYKVFVNLMPIKDYTVDIGNYMCVKSTKVVPPHSFGDADILTHIAMINKLPINGFKSKNEFCAESFIVDKPFIKFMKSNELRTHYAIDSIHGWKPTENVNNCFAFHEFRCKSQHTCGMDMLESKSVANEYNFNNVEITNKTEGISGTLMGAYYVIPFKSSIEKKNFVKFYKENRNFINRMIANQFIAIRDYAACFPKVDWSKSDWTIEKILKEVANYTDEEIKMVIDTMDIDYTIKNDGDISRLFGAYL